MSEKQSYRKKIEASMEQWNAEIDKLEARADRAEADMQLQYYEELKKLRALQEEARGKLEELEEAGDDTREELERAVDNATNAIERAMSVTLSRFT
jgi:predicted  nucleic acid-binding Zn-ribbon protein